MEYQLKHEKSFRYIEVGEGQPLVLLHGLMGELSNWNHTIEHFRHHYRVLVPILPIYEVPLLKLGVRALSSHLFKFIKYKNLTDVLLVGNSLGGHVALVCTVAHQSYLKALVLTGSSGLYENAFGGSFPRRESYDYVREKVEFTFYDPATATKELVDEVFKTINDRGRVIRILSMAKSAIRHNMAKELHKITIPTALIWGKNDKVTPPEVAEEFNQLIPNCQLHWVDKCGHAPMMEHPDEFNTLLANFLQSVNS